MTEPLNTLSELKQRLANDPAAADPLLACGMIAPHTLMLVDGQGRPEETLFGLGLSGHPAWIDRMRAQVQNGPEASERWGQLLAGTVHAIPTANLVLRAFREGWWTTATALLDSLAPMGLEHQRAQVLPPAEAWLKTLVTHHANQPDRFAAAVGWLHQEHLVMGEAPWSRPINLPRVKPAVPLITWLAENRPWSYMKTAWDAGARPVDDNGHPLLWRWYAAGWLTPSTRLDPQEQSRRMEVLVNLTREDPERWETSWEQFGGKQYVGMWEAMNDDDKAVARAALNGRGASRRLPLGWLLRATGTPMGQVLNTLEEGRVLRASLDEAPSVPSGVRPRSRL